LNLLIGPDLPADSPWRPVAASLEALPHHASPDAATDALIAELRAVIADLRGERDRLLTIAERQALPAPKRRWWQRSTG
jgi:hypothetical protein